MNTKQLFLAIGDLDGDLIWMEQPKKQRRSMYAWMLAAAAAVVVGVLGYTGLMEWQRQQPPVIDPMPVVTTTTVYGTGGDENACTVHSFDYHSIDGGLLDLVSDEQFEEYLQTYDREGHNVVTFVEYFGITREQFIAAMKWEGKLSEQWSEYDPYTHGMLVDAIYGDDAEFSAWLFSHRLAWDEDVPPCDVFLTEEACTAHPTEYHRINEELIRLAGGKRWRSYLTHYGGKGEDANILTFIAYCGITREDYVMTMGWQDNLDSIAADHGDVSYTYGEFVEAIYGSDPALKVRIFGKQ